MSSFAPEGVCGTSGENAPTMSRLLSMSCVCDVPKHFLPLCQMLADHFIQLVVVPISVSCLFHLQPWRVRDLAVKSFEPRLRCASFTPSLELSIRLWNFVRSLEILKQPTWNETWTEIVHIIFAFFASHWTAPSSVTALPGPMPQTARGALDGIWKRGAEILCGT